MKSKRQNTIFLQGIKRDEEWLHIPDQDRELIMKGILNSDIIPEELLGLEGTPPPEEAIDVNIEKVDNDEIDNEEQVIRSLPM